MMLMTRDTLISTLETALAAHTDVLALWLEGADAEGRADVYSDIDLWIAAEDDREVLVLAFVREQSKA